MVVHAPVVVSSCGSIHTPALLLRSGITVGGNVGANLRLHPATGTVGVFARSAQQAAAGQGAVQMYKVTRTAVCVRNRRVLRGLCDTNRRGRGGCHS